MEETARDGLSVETGLRRCRTSVLSPWRPREGQSHREGQRPVKPNSAVQAYGTWRYPSTPDAVALPRTKVSALSIARSCPALHRAAGGSSSGAKYGTPFWKYRQGGTECWPRQT